MDTFPHPFKAPTWGFGLIYYWSNPLIASISYLLGCRSEWTGKKSITRLSNFNFLWSTTVLAGVAGVFPLRLPAKRLKPCKPYRIFFFFHNFQVLPMFICNKLYEITEKMKVKIVFTKISFCEIWSFWRLFSGAPIGTFSLELFHITYYICSPQKVLNRMQ